MYLIYVDEYGTSGGRLDNPQESYFSLSAALVEEKKWGSLENDILALQIQAIQELYSIGSPPIERFEFHAADMLQGKKVFKGLHISRQLFYAEQLLKIAKKNDVLYFGVGLEKSVLKEQFDDMLLDDSISPEIRQANLVLRSRLSPYSTAFCYILCGINKWLIRQVERGLLIFDEHSQYGKLANLVSYARARNTTDTISNILAAPFYADSKIHTPLQIADLRSYISGRHEVAEIRNEDVKPAIIKQWIDTYIEPSDISNQEMKMIIHGQEIVDMSVALLEEMWPASFSDLTVQKYCSDTTRMLLLSGQIA